jgi:hypothetical protein
MTTSTATQSIPPNLQLLLWLAWLDSRPESCCPCSLAIDDITEDELTQWCGG